MTDVERYSSPLAERYASQAMLRVWSPQTRHGLWRRLWLALAESEKELGVAIPDEAIAQMRAHLDDIDFAAVAAFEKRFRHDVMAHVHAFADLAPAAGATSAKAWTCAMTSWRKRFSYAATAVKSMSSRWTRIWAIASSGIATPSSFSDSASASQSRRHSPCRVCGDQRRSIAFDA